MLEQDYDFDEILDEIEGYIPVHEHYPDYIEGDIYEDDYDYDYNSDPCDSDDTYY